MNTISRSMQSVSPAPGRSKSPGRSRQSDRDVFKSLLDSAMKQNAKAPEFASAQSGNAPANDRPVAENKREPQSNAKQDAPDAANSMAGQAAAAAQPQQAPSADANAEPVEGSAGTQAPMAVAHAEPYALYQNAAAAEMQVPAGTAAAQPDAMPQATPLPAESAPLQGQTASQPAANGNARDAITMTFEGNGPGALAGETVELHTGNVPNLRKIETMQQEAVGDAIKSAMDNLNGSAKTQKPTQAGAETASAATEAAAKESQARQGRPAQVVREVPEQFQAKVPQTVSEKENRPPVMRVLEKAVQPKALAEEPEKVLVPAATDLKQAAQPQISAVGKAGSTESNQPLPMEQVKQQIIESYEKGRMEFRMQLYPQELGKLDIKMVLESGRMTIEIVTSTARAADLLTRNAESLASTLRMSGMDLQNVQIVHQADNRNEHMEQALDMGGGYQPEPGGGQAQDAREEGGVNGTAQTNAGEAQQEELPPQEAAEPASLLDYAV